MKILFNNLHLENPDQIKEVSVNKFEKKFEITAANQQPVDFSSNFFWGRVYSVQNGNREAMTLVSFNLFETALHWMLSFIKFDYCAYYAGRRLNFEKPKCLSLGDLKRGNVIQEQAKKNIYEPQVDFQFLSWEHLSLSNPTISMKQIKQRAEKLKQDVLIAKSIANYIENKREDKSQSMYLYFDSLNLMETDMALKLLVMNDAIAGFKKEDLIIGQKITFYFKTKNDPKIFTKEKLIEIDRKMSEESKKLNQPFPRVILQLQKKYKSIIKEFNTTPSREQEVL